MWNLIFLGLFIWWLVVAIMKYKEYKSTSNDKRFEVEPFIHAAAWPYYRIASWIDKNVKY